MPEPPFAALDNELSRAAEGFHGGAGVDALKHGRRVLAALLAHRDWDGQDDRLKMQLLHQGGGILLHLFQQEGDAGVLEEAASVLTVAAHLLAEDDPDRPEVLANLAVAIRNGAERHGDLGELERAIGLQRASLAGTAPEDASYPRRLSNLGASLRTLHGLSGLPGAIDEAVDQLRLAVAQSPRPEMATNLAMTLRDRHEATGSRADLEEAIGLAESALAATPDGHPARATRLNNLGLLFGSRFLLDGHVRDGDAAVGALRMAVDLSPIGAVDRPYRLCNLGNQYSAIFHRTGDRAAIVEAERVYVQALAGGTYGPEGMAMLKMGLGRAQSVLGELEGDERRLESAVAAAREALEAIPLGAARRGAYAAGLSEALRALGRALKRPSALEDAARLLKAEAESGPPGPLAVRLHLSQAAVWIDHFRLTGARESAQRAGALARGGVSGLQALALAGGVQTADMEIAGRVSLAVGAILARTGDIEGAAEHLEAGRTVRLRADLQRGAAPEPTDAGADEAIKSARDQVRRARVRLEHGPAATGKDQAERLAAARMLEAATATLVSLQGDEANPAPMTFADIVQTAAEADATLAYLYAGDLDGGVVLVSAQGAHHVDLPGMAGARARIHAGAEEGLPEMERRVARGERVGWIAAYRQAFSAEVLGNDWLWQATLQETLDWLGAECVAPLAEALPGLATSRLCLLPSDDLALLPIHAALMRDGRPLLAVQPVFYAPSAALLRAAQTRPALSAPHLVAANAQGDLPFAETEGRTVASAGKAWFGPAVTARRLSSMLAEGGRVHLAIHARFDARAPLESVLHAAGSEAIRLRDLLAGSVPLRQGVTIVASACETGVFNTSNAGEQIGFGAVFLAAGARRVAATLWPANDLATALLMMRMADFEAAGLDLCDALTQAILWLRAASGPELAVRMRRSVGELASGSPLEFPLKTALRALDAETRAPFAQPTFWAEWVCLGAI